MARTFTGTGTYIDIGSISTPSSAITVAGWMYPTEGATSAQQESAIIHKEFGAGAPFLSYHLCPTTNIGQWDVDFKLGVSGALHDAQKINHSISTNTWYHLVGTWASGDNSRLYINGVQEGISGSTITGTIDYGAFNTFIGRNTPDVRVFRGRLAHCVIWDVQLSAAEILALYTAQRIIRTRYDNIVRYFPVWGLHSPEIDLSKNRGTGTITGTLNLASDPPTPLYNSLRHIENTPLYDPFISVSNISIFKTIRTVNY